VQNGVKGQLAHAYFDCVVAVETFVVLLRTLDFFLEEAPVVSVFVAAEVGQVAVRVPQKMLRQAQLAGE